MTQVSGFALLPAELVIECFTLALESECEQHCRNNTAEWWGPALIKAGFSGPSLLAPIHLDSRLRSILLASKRFWRLAAEKISSSTGFRAPWQTRELIKYCDELSGQTLQRLDFRRSRGRLKNCPSKTMRLVDTAMPSVRSLQYLQLPCISHKSYHWVCKCSSCRLTAWTDSRDATIKTAWTRILSLLQRASSLKQLELTTPDRYYSSTKELEEQTTALEARPTHLVLTMQSNLPVSLLSFFLQLASRAETLCFSLWGAADDGFAIAALIQAASSTLRALRLEGGLNDEPIMALFGHDLPCLAHLHVSSDPEGEISLPITVRPCRFNGLTSLEGPIGIMSSFEAPSVERLAVTLDVPLSADLVEAKLSAWIRLEDLVLIFDTYSELDTTEAIRRVLRHLTPTRSKSAVPCPRLQRFGITCRWISSLEWIRTETEDAYEVPWGEPQSWSCVPVIGLDLLNFDTQRSQTQQCLPLKVIKILDCHVDPKVWRAVAKRGQQNNQSTFCQPEPTKFRQDLHRDHLFELLDWLKEEFRKLNKAKIEAPTQ